MSKEKLITFSTLAAGMFLLVVISAITPSCEKVRKQIKEQTASGLENGRPETNLRNDAKRVQGNRKVAIMTPQQIVERIKQKDWTLVDEPGTVSADAASAILPLLEDDDPEVRELAVYCLNEAGGIPACRGLPKVLNDPEDGVRSAACRFLLTHHDQEQLPILLKELSANEDAYVRRHVALVIGKIGDPSVIEALKNQAEKEPDAPARHAIFIALVRLGEPKNRQAYLDRLQDKDPRQRALTLRDFEYIGDRSLLPHVVPLLDDLRDAVNVAPSNFSYFIRVCDVTVNVLDVVLDHPFSFKVEQVRRYSPRELNEAKSIALKSK